MGLGKGMISGRARRQETWAGHDFQSFRQGLPLEQVLASEVGSVPQRLKRVGFQFLRARLEVVPCPPGEM